MRPKLRKSTDLVLSIEVNVRVRSGDYLRYDSYLVGPAWPSNVDPSWNKSEDPLRPALGLGHALEMVEVLRKHCFQLVMTSGTFDLLNIGHEQYLKIAASYGGVLIVGVDSDKKVKQRKGPDRPICCQHARMKSVSRHPSVSLVILKRAEMVKWSLVRAVRPDVLVVSNLTYSEAELTELGFYCNRIVVVERTGMLSTSWLIKAAENSGGINIARNAFTSPYCVRSFQCEACV